MKIKYLLKNLFSLLIFVFMSQSLLYSNSNIYCVIKIGYTPGYGVIDDINSLDYKGFGYDILTRAEHYSNFKFEFIQYNYFDALKALENGEIDLIGMTLGNEKYAEFYQYVPKKLGIAQLILASKNENVMYSYNPQFLEGKTIASFYNNPYEKYLDKFCKENNVSISYIKDDVDKYLDLDADLYLVTTIEQKAKNLNLVMNLDIFDLYFLSNNKKLADKLAKAINMSVSTDGTFLDELQIKYFGNKDITRRYLTKEELTLLRKRPLVSGYISHHRPIQYTDNLGNPDGISIQIMNFLAKKYDFEIQFVPYDHDMPFSSHEKFDMLISTTGDFEHEMSFYTTTMPFLELPLMLFSGKEDYEEIVSENKSSVLGILNYITINHSDIEKRYPKTKIKSYTSFNKMMEDYKNEKLDGILATIIGAQYAQNVLGAEKYSMHSTGLNLPLRVFLSKDLENLIKYKGAFNIMFEHLDQNIVDEIMSTQSISFLPEYSATTFIKENLNKIIIFILGIMLIIVCIVFYFQYKKKIDILNIINNDDLTNLISLYNFKQKASKILQLSKQNEYEIISIDVDSFKTINTLYSHEKGNQVINSIANTLIKIYGKTNALVARVIADQFVILQKKQEVMFIKKICEENIISAIKNEMGEKYNISMSIGSYLISNSSIKIDEAIDAAIIARLRGKQKYNITYHEYDEKIKKEQEMKTSIVFRMKDALNNGEFKVVYQPKIKFDTLKIDAAEALVRWHSSSEYGIISPDAFIGIFESNGFIIDLDLYIFEEVCKFIVEQKNINTLPLISVNLSVVTLFDNRFPSSYLDILSKYNLQANKLEIEVTESAVTSAQNILIEKVKEIRKLGFHLSIDDFGAGESSLNRLSSIEVDTIKLDKAFLDYNIAEEKGAIVVRNMIKMAKELKMKVVSEGVETKEQAIWLKKLGCDYAQGYYFEKPLSKDNFINLLKTNKVYKLQ